LEVNQVPESLKQSVEDALRAYTPLSAPRSEIVVTVDDGKVVLSGYVPSVSSKGIASVLAAGVDGVSEVVNNLMASPELETAVAAALAADPRPRRWPIRVRAELGYVQLQGHVPDQEAAQIALEVARKVKGPKQVFSALQVRPSLAAAA
jgi:osmotically-inducible protein OsmY